MKTFEISHKMGKSQFLSQAMKDKMKDHAGLNKLELPIQPYLLWFFSDGKNFCQDKINLQNNHWLALSQQDVLILMRNKHFVHIIVYGVITSNGDVIPLFQTIQFSMSTQFDCQKHFYFKIFSLFKQL